jgi:hypothetical protein
MNLSYFRRWKEGSEMASRMYYLQLPEEVVPQALFEQEVRSRRVNIVFESTSGPEHVVGSDIRRSYDAG